MILKAEVDCPHCYEQTELKVDTDRDGHAPEVDVECRKCMRFFVAEVEMSVSIGVRDKQ